MFLYLYPAAETFTIRAGEDSLIRSEQVGQEEVTQMIHSELHLEAILCQSVWTHKDSCVVNENVDPWFFFKNQSYELAYWCEWGKVELSEHHIIISAFSLNVKHSFLPFLHIATSQNDSSIPLGEVYGCCFSNSCVTPRDDDSSSSQWGFRIADTSSKESPYKVESEYNR